jgi:hypothetical protein
MKAIAIVILMGIVLFSSDAARAATVNAPGISYLAVYADSNHSVCESWNVSGTFYGEAYVFCLPSSKGIVSVSYELNLPPWGQCSNITYCPGATLIYDEGYHITLPHCINDWAWLMKFDLVVYCGISNPPTGLVEVVPINLWDCSNPPRQNQDYRVLNPLAINQHCSIGFTRPSWGEIKAMYK